LLDVKKKEEILALPEELNNLLEAGVHFGHKAKRWNPKMKKFIFGKRRGIYIIDLEKTLQSIKEAREFLAEVIKEGKDILFVGTKKQAQGVVSNIAQSYKMPYVINRWVGGFLTNSSTIRTRVEKYKELVAKRDSEGFEKLPKKEVVWLNKKLVKMQRNFEGIKDMTRLPGALVVIDPRKEIHSVREGKKLGIPIVSLIDTDSDPRIIDYPIPANDDALRSIKTVLALLMDPLKDLVQEREKRIQAVKQKEQDSLEENKQESAEEQGKPEKEDSAVIKKAKNKPATEEGVQEKS
jgi:small subunit ribosomal protein S2